MKCMRNDEGFSLVEVMFAAVIAFFMLTAMFGVVVASAGGSRSASVESVGTAVGNQLIEQIRSLAYGDIGTVGGDPSGTLLADETVVSQGQSFTVHRVVTWVDDPSNGGTPNDRDYKYVHITVRGPEGSVQDMETYVRDRSGESPQPPSVAFDNTVPPQNSIVFHPSGATADAVWPNLSYSGSWDQGMDVFLKGSADSTGAAGVITRFEFWVDGRLLLNPRVMGDPNVIEDDTTGIGYSDYAAWLPNSMHYANQPGVDVSPGVNFPFAGGFPINSLALDSSGSRVMADGWRTFRVMAWASSGSRDYKTLNLFVDNDPPSWAATPTITPPTRMADIDVGKFTVNWQTPTDGVDGTGVKIPVGSLGKSAKYDLWITTNGYTTTYTRVVAPPATSYVVGPSSVKMDGSALGFTPTPFTSYRVQIVGHSARNLQAESVRTDRFITAPRFVNPTNVAYASGNGSNAKYKVTFNWSGPGAGLLSIFGADHVVYTLYDSTTAPTSAILGGTALVSNMTGTNVSFTDRDKSAFHNHYYQIKATLVNWSGTPVATTGPFYSTIVGPAPVPATAAGATLTIPLSTTP